MRTVLRPLSVVVLSVALVWGLFGFVQQVGRDQRAGQPTRPDLTAYAGAVCSGLAGPADAYRAMIKVPNDRKTAPNVGLKNWYVAYLQTMNSTSAATLTALESSGVGSDAELAQLHGKLTDFFGHAKEFSARGEASMRALNVDDPRFNSKIDRLTGGSIAPEQFEKLLTTARGNRELDAAMARTSTCEPAANDLRLVVQGKMLDLFAGTRTI